MNIYFCISYSLNVKSCTFFVSLIVIEIQNLHKLMWYAIYKPEENPPKIWQDEKHIISNLDKMTYLYFIVEQPPKKHEQLFKHST